VPKQLVRAVDQMDLQGGLQHNLIRPAASQSTGEVDRFPPITDSSVLATMDSMPKADYWESSITRQAA
jgi:hypothetical protein